MGVFQPWKHYQNQAIQDAVQSFDLEYSITSFFRDLTSIRQKTMKPYTIIGAFRESGTWPISCKAGLKKIRQYAKKKKTSNDDYQSLQVHTSSVRNLYKNGLNEDHLKPSVVHQKSDIQRL